MMRRLCVKCNMPAREEKCDCGGETCGCMQCQAMVRVLTHTPAVEREARRLAAERFDALEAKHAEMSAVPILAIGVVAAGDNYGRSVVMPCQDQIAEADVPAMLRKLAEGLEKAAKMAKAGSN